MSNTTISERNTWEGSNYADGATLVGRPGAGAAFYSLIGIVLSGVLFWGAVTLITGWHAWVVFGVILWTFVGLVVAVNPNRRG